MGNPILLVVLLMGLVWIAVASYLKKVKKLYYFNIPNYPSSTLCTDYNTRLNPCTDPPPLPPLHLASLVDECPPSPSSSPSTPSPTTPASSSSPPPPSSSSSPSGYKYPPFAPCSYILPSPPPSSKGNDDFPSPPLPSETDNNNTLTPSPSFADTFYAPPPPSDPNSSYTLPPPPKNGCSAYYRSYPYYYMYTPSASSPLNLRFTALPALFLESVLFLRSLLYVLIFYRIFSMESMENKASHDGCE